MSSASLTGLSILIVEDETFLRKQIASHLLRLGAEVTEAGTVGAARRYLQQLNFDFVLLDINLPDGRGLDLLKEKVCSANTGAIIMTAEDGAASAVAAMRLGALDYLVKPFDPGELPLVIGLAQKARQSARVDEHRRHDAQRSGQVFFFGKSMTEVQRQLEKILAADTRMQNNLPPVLIEGETGTGKTTIARWLHDRGPRAAQPLVEINCSALPDTLAESEMFGHERGAFTDARTARIGLFEAATGGTLFLDELPSLSQAMQAKVLKVIEDQRIRRLGGNKELPVDVRIMAATHRDLPQLMAAGQFREDLYHRLDLYRIRLPPLRERGEDILKLAELMVQQLWQRHRLPPKAITPAGQQRLLRYHWPGNVRELSHELERAIVFEDSHELNFQHLAQTRSASAAPDSADWLNPNFTFPSQGFSLESAINRFIQHALQQCEGNVSAAARLLGVPRDYVRYRLSQKKSMQGSEDSLSPNLGNGSQQG